MFTGIGRKKEFSSSTRVNSFFLLFPPSPAWCSGDVLKGISLMVSVDVKHRVYLLTKEFVSCPFF